MSDPMGRRVEESKFFDSRVGSSAHLDRKLSGPLNPRNVAVSNNSQSHHIFTNSGMDGPYSATNQSDGIVNRNPAVIFQNEENRSVKSESVS